MSGSRLPLCSRRHLLQSSAVAVAATALPRWLRASQQVPPKLPPFSKFTNVAAQAGLTQPVVYGVPGQVTYIIESMGGGCAFFDYDNDGWMDIFIWAAGVSTAFLRAQATASTITIAMALLPTSPPKPALTTPDGRTASASAITTTTASKISSSPTTATIASTATTADGTFTDVTAKAGLLHPDSALRHRVHVSRLQPRWTS